MDTDSAILQANFVITNLSKSYYTRAIFEILIKLIFLSNQQAFIGFQVLSSLNI